MNQSLAVDSLDLVLFPTLRYVVDRGLAMAEADGLDVRQALCFAAENVEPINGFRMESLPEDVDLTVFMCATVGIHTDLDVHRYSYLYYLGPVEGGDAVHAVSAMPEACPDIDLDSPDARKQLGERYRLAATHALQPGNLVSLDVHVPHWMGVTVGGRKLGHVFAPPPDPCNLDPMFKGVPLARATGLFVALAAEEPLPRTQLRALLQTLRYGPEPASAMRPGGI